MTPSDTPPSAELARLAPLRARLALVFGVQSRALLPARGFGHAIELLGRLQRGDGAARILTVGEGTDASEVLALVRANPGAILLCDERRIDWSSRPSLGAFAAETCGVVVYREIGASFGAGEPLCGALIGEPSQIDRITTVIDADFLHPLIVAEALKAVAPPRLLVRAARIEAFRAERARLMVRLATAPHVVRVIEGEGGGVCVEASEPDCVLRRARALDADVSLLADGTIRIVIGEASANDRVLAAFGADPARKAPRIGEAVRETKETKVAARVDLDRAGKVRIDTGIGYFDHMLEQIAAHGGFALTLACEGDRHVDLHHTIEDCALALGAALSTALGERRGIARYGFTLPMDEAQATVSIDLGGRPYCLFEGAFAAPLLGDYPTEMTSHVFRSLAQTLGAAVHVAVRGENDHHKTEAAFKAFARALRAAIAVESDALPSTKGVI